MRNKLRTFKTFDRMLKDVNFNFFKFLNKNKRKVNQVVSSEVTIKTMNLRIKKKCIDEDHEKKKEVLKNLRD